MTESPYWNPRHETMSRAEIEALQVRKLRNLLEWTDGTGALPLQAATGLWSDGGLDRLSRRSAAHPVHDS